MPTFPPFVKFPAPFTTSPGIHDRPNGTKNVGFFSGVRPTKYRQQHGFSRTSQVIIYIYICIYIWYPPQNRHFQDCNAFGIVTLFSLRSSGAVSYIYMHIYTHMYIICYLTITKSMYLEYFLQEVFANVCKRLQTFLIRIQDSRFPEKLLESKGIGFTIQDSRFPEKLLESQDSRFKIPRKNS